MTTIDYLLVVDAAVDVMGVAAQLLKEIYDDLYEEGSEAADLAAAVEVRYCRPVEGRSLAGVSIEFDQAIADDVGAEQLVSGMTGRLLAASDLGIFHVVKCGDPVMFEENRLLAIEIYEFEMRLREALTIIFIEAVGEDYYALLDDVRVRISNPPDRAQMQTVGENQFFHLVFSDYTSFQRRVPSDAAGIRRLITESADFNDLKARLSPSLPLGEEHEDFLAKIRVFVSSVEKVRNAVMHNRAVPETARQDYETAKGPLREALDDFFAAL